MRIRSLIIEVILRKSDILSGLFLLSLVLFVKPGVSQEAPFFIPLGENQIAAQAYPNILIITVDNVGYGDYRIFNPESRIHTPTLEKMANDGAVLTNFYTAGATCTVSRAALLTGRIPQRNKLDYQLAGIAGNYGIGLRHSEIILPEVIKESEGNYVTGAFGKWNIGFAPGSRPVDRGFDEYLGIVSGNADPYTHVYAGLSDLHYNNERVSRTGEYSTDLFADEAIRFINKNSAHSTPWFVYLAFDAPHSPGERNIAPGENHTFQAPERAYESYDFSPDEKDQSKQYSAVVTAIDQAMGRVLDNLDSMGILDNTFIFFYSDNGANLSTVQERIMGKQFSFNTPFRGGRSTLYEGGIRVPAIAMWKGTIPPGQVIHTRLWSPDVFMSSVQLSGASLPTDRFFDGKNILPVLKAESTNSPHAALYFEDGDDDALIWGEWKIVREKEEQPWQLYNLQQDQSESLELSKDYPELVQKLGHAFDQQKQEIISYHQIQQDNGN